MPAAQNISSATSQPRQIDGEGTALIEKGMPILVEWYKTLMDVSQPVGKLMSPKQIDSAFQNRTGTGIQLDGTEKVDSEEQVLNMLRATLEMSPRNAHPLFLNQLYSGCTQPAMLGELLCATTNTNAHTYEVAPVMTLVERACIAKLVRVWQSTPADEPTPDHDGLFVPGGSFGNLYGLLVARHRADPELRNRGFWGGPKLVAFCSSGAHYSQRKAAMTSGLGDDNMRLVPCDEHGRMRVDALVEMIEECKRKGEKPFYVGATAGSTVLGAFDPLDDIANVCEANNLWMHVDACWGGMTLFSKTHRARLMHGVERADSMAWNPHKMMNVPMTCASFLCKHANILSATNSLNASYLFQPDKNFTEQDIGDKTIQCGRKADGFKLWMAWKCIGDEGWTKLVDDTYAIAAHTEKSVRASNGRFVMVVPHSCTNVCFWYIPPHMRPFDRENATPAQWKELGSVAPKIKNQMQLDGDAMIGFNPYGDFPNFFRVVYAGARGLSGPAIDALLERMDKIGTKIFEDENA